LAGYAVASPEDHPTPVDPGSSGCRQVAGLTVGGDGVSLGSLAAEVVVAGFKAMACEPPQARAVPLSRWSSAELAAPAVAEGWR
jgi:hypothetical protein